MGFSHVVSTTRCSLQALSLQTAPTIGMGRRSITRTVEGMRSFWLPRSSSHVNCGYIISMTFSNIPSPKNFTWMLSKGRPVRTWRPQGYHWSPGSIFSSLAWRTLAWRRDRAAYLSISWEDGSVSLLDPRGGIPSWLTASQWNQRGMITT